MKLLITLFLILVSTSLYAAETYKPHTLSWTLATTRTDGKALAPSEITATEIRYGDLPAALKNKAITTVAAPGLTHAVTPTVAGSHCYQIRTVAGSQVSAWTPSKCADAVVVIAPPNPPVLQVTQ